MHSMKGVCTSLKDFVLMITSLPQKCWSRLDAYSKGLLAMPFFITANITTDYFIVYWKTSIGNGKSKWIGPAGTLPPTVRSDRGVAPY